MTYSQILHGGRLRQKSNKVITSGQTKIGDFLC